MSTENAEDMNQTITKKEVKTYSFDDVAKHKTKNDCWMVIHNKVYDCTEFAKTHPGGDIIVLAAGIDATVMFESYHTTDYPYKLLDKYCIGELDKPVPSYYQWGKSDFYPTLKKRVVERLKQLNRPRRGPLELHIKAFIIIFTLMATWVVGFFFAGFGSWELCIAMALLHGVAAAHVGLSIMHDGNHGSFAKSPLANKIAGMGMDLIGSSGITWEYQHVVGHHPFTNLETATDINLEYHRNLQSPPTNPDAKNFVLSQENDPDVFSSFPLVRMHHRDPRSWFHKYQAIYAPLLFSLFTMGKVFISDISFYIAGRVSHVDMSSRLTELSERIRFIGFKLLNFTFMIVIPGYLHGPLFAFGMLFLAHCVCGEYLGLAFIVNHITDLAEFFTGGEDIGLEGADKKDENENKKKVDERDWAYCQAKATANWGVESWFWNAFSGGLNHQLEHHLLPGISHVNYPYIAPVVRETCEEYGVPYIALPSFYSAIKHMLFYLDALGKEDKPKTGLENLEESITDKKEQ